MKAIARDDLIALLLDHQARHPDKGAWPVEIRDRWLIAPPLGIEHCPIDRVIILRGEPVHLLTHTGD